MMTEQSQEVPSVSIFMISYNDGKIIEECLISIRSQVYPQEKIEIIMLDGGSTDNTPEIAKKYNVNFIVRSDLKDKPGLRTEIAVLSSKSALIMAFSADNRFQEDDCLRRMVDPFSDPRLTACETLRYGWRKSDTPVCRYMALIGGADPVAIGLGKADRMPHDTSGWESYGKVKDHTAYIEVKFEKDISKVPTLGMNGCMYRRDMLDKVGGMGNGAHIETCVRLIEAGYNKFAFIKDRHIVHYINIPTISFIKRRMKWADMYSAEKIRRTYHVFNPEKDLFKLIWITVSYVTVVFPLLRAMKGFARKPDPAWFLHPLICLAFVSGYGLHVIKKYLR